jgi:hypothetical protein
MFGSSAQHRFLKGRKVVLNLDRLTLPALDVLAQLNDFINAYEGDKSALLFGYWDSDSSLVVTAPDDGEQMVNCPNHENACELCYGTGQVTASFALMIVKISEKIR